MKLVFLKSTPPPEKLFRKNKKKSNALFFEKNLMQRYKSKYGVVYEICEENGSHLLSKIHTDVKMVRRKEVVTERKQHYLRSSEEDCLKYMFEVDEF